MALSVERAVSLFKSRRDMMQGISPRDEYIETRVRATMRELADRGIHLVDTDADLMLVVDMAVWQYNNRDNPGSMPDWLRLARRERWLNDKAINQAYAAQMAEVSAT